MEQAEGHKNKLANFARTLNSSKAALEIDPASQAANLQNTLKSGQIRNFEFCVELMWKAVKSYLEEFDGVTSSGPKQVIKEFLKTGHISDIEYDSLFSMLNDRNLLSHIYSENESEAIIKKLPENYFTLSKVLTALDAQK